MDMNTILIITAISLFFAVLLFRTAILFFQPRKTASAMQTVPLLPEQIERLSRAIQFKTVSFADVSLVDSSRFSAFIGFLKQSFPNIFSRLDVTILSDYALLIKWTGVANKDLPVMFYAHYDVVDADDTGWQYPPFSGTVAEERIWGRGTLDTKNTLMASLEAVETLLQQGFSPQRTLYIACGGDEETTSERGAVVIRDHLISQNIRLDWILDEGSCAITGLPPMVADPIAIVGVSEKGYMNVRLGCEGVDGHASMPPVMHGGDRLVRALYRVHKYRFPIKMLPEVALFFKTLVPCVSFPLAVIWSNLWLFSGLMCAILKKDDATRTLLQTTVVATTINSGSRCNVLPLESEANLNIRILPGETRETVCALLKKIIDDPAVTVTNACEEESFEPINASPINSDGYRTIKKVIEQVAPSFVTAPLLCNVTTDSKFFSQISSAIYRFSPMLLTPGDRKTIHSRNESISIENYCFGINFYTQMIQSL
ncbi:MAG: M20/M25/M40 family metallo-hydrolase [Spirochaetes bacterium]|jgi:carboxypeptidase PM20D1|nr:M20/M25/M40 family metallo-hydrolase [Spirochaetota bacterium]